MTFQPERILCAFTLSGLVCLLSTPGLALASTEVAKLLAADGASQDYFGLSVAVEGDTALIGAHRDDDNDFSSGSAYVFVFDGIDWSQQAKLTANDGALGDFFGISVSVDGETAVVGADGDDDNGLRSGSAYVFVVDGGGWTQQAKLTADDGTAGDRFGFSISMDGDTAAVGASSDDDIAEDAGSAYLFVRDGAGSWTQQAKLTADDGAGEDHFGVSVSVDGDTAVVGAFLDDDMGTDSGSAYVFVRDGAGDWIQQTKLTADDGAAGDLFGVSVALDGDTAVVGAVVDDAVAIDSGSAYVFVRDGSGNWDQQAKLTASDGEAGDSLGIFVSVDGDTALLGARSDDDLGNNSGSAYIFVRDGSGTWNQRAKLTASDGAAGDLFGISVSVDGDTALIGAGEDDDLGSESGSAYVFELADTTPPGWPVGCMLTASEIGLYDLTLCWTAAVDDNGVAEYEIHEATAGLIGTAPGTSTCETVVGLVPETVYDFSIEACDPAGNCSVGGPCTATVETLSPTEAINVLHEAVEDLHDLGVLNGGQTNSLQVKLEQAFARLEAGATRPAMNILNAFINQVLDLVASGVLTSAEGQALMDAAEEILLAI